MQKLKLTKRMRQQFLQHLLKPLYHLARLVFFIVKMKQEHGSQEVVGYIRQISNIVYYGSSLAGQLSWLERRNHNPQVGGSNPSPATIKFPLFLPIQMHQDIQLSFYPMHSFHQLLTFHLHPYFLSTFYFQVRVIFFL